MSSDPKLFVVCVPPDTDAVVMVYESGQVQWFDAIGSRGVLVSESVTAKAVAAQLHAAAMAAARPRGTES